MFQGTFSKIYLAFGVMVVLGYLATEARGMVFSGTDLPASIASGGGGSRTGRSTGGTAWFGGYSGGK